MEAVFKYGSPAVAEWLASTGWHANTIWDRRFPDRALVEAYADALRANMPSDGQSVFAVLGGWHLSWPEGDWQDLVDYPLIVLTLAESEPWVEAFGVNGGFRVIQRIS